MLAMPRPSKKTHYFARYADEQHALSVICLKLRVVNVEKLV